MSSLFETGVSQDGAVAISAAIAAASALLTVSNSVLIVYQIFPGNGEGNLNNCQSYAKISQLFLFVLYINLKDEPMARLSLCRINVGEQNQQR